MNKKIIIGVLAVLAIIGGAFLISHQTKGQVTVGVLVPLTGPSAGIGERVKRGIEAGLQEVKDTHGYPFTVVIEDDKGDAPTAVSAAQKIITTDGVHVIIGTVKSDAMLAVAPITEQDHAILLSPTAGADKISQAGDYVFRLIELANAHGDAATAYLNGKGVTRAALFVAQASNAQSYGAAFEKSFAQEGGTITSKTPYDQTSTDFRTDIAKALKEKPDAVYLGGATAKDAGRMVRPIREAGFTGLVMESVAADAKEFFDTAGPAGEGTVITASFFDASSTAGATFNRYYRAIAGVDGDGFAANGYDAVVLISKALEKCHGDTDTACIRDFLYATKDYQGAGGMFSFDANGDVTKPVAIKVAHDNAFVLQSN